MTQVGPIPGIFLKQNTTYTRVFWFGTTGQTLTVVLSKAGGTFAGSSNTAAEIANGWYKLSLNVADVNTLGDLAYHVTATTGGPLDFSDQVVSQLPTDIQLANTGRVLISDNIQQNVALSGFTFLMVNSSTGQPATGLTVTAQRSIGGAGFAPCANAVSEVGNGIYSINLAASDLNGSTIMLRFTSTTASDLDILLITTP